jgi:hypothetical protein
LQRAVEDCMDFVLEDILQRLEKGGKQVKDRRKKD